jgi:hypothetical protein
MGWRFGASGGEETVPAGTRGTILHCKAVSHSAAALARWRPSFARREENVRHREGGVPASVAQV